MKKWIYFTVFAATALLAGGLQAETTPPTEPMPPANGGMFQTMIMLALGVLFLYFIMWRPEQKRRKALEEQRKALKKGDRVSAVGIIGTVSAIKQQTIVLKMIDGSKIEFLKAAINDVLPPLSEEEADKNAKENEA